MVTLSRGRIVDDFAIGLSKKSNTSAAPRGVMQRIVHKLSACKSEHGQSTLK